MTEKLKPCAKCGRLKTNKELFVYVDGNNLAITNSSPAFCKKCYSEQYPNDSLRDKSNFLRWALTCLAGEETMNVENINSDNLILQRRFLDLKHINDILKEEPLNVSVRVQSEKHGIKSFLITREEALALLEPKISDLEKKVEAL